MFWCETLKHRCVTLCFCEKHEKNAKYTATKNTFKTTLEVYEHMILSSFTLCNRILIILGTYQIQHPFLMILDPFLKLWGC